MEKRLEAAIQRRLTPSDLQEVREHGVDCGFDGFIYYYDTIRFYIKHRAEINKLVKESAEEMGEGIINFVKSFRCLNATDEEVAETLFGPPKKINAEVANALTWFAVEALANEQGG